jgi:hypothetical protein
LAALIAQMLIRDEGGSLFPKREALGFFFR